MFEGVAGNHAVKEYFKNAFAHRNIASSYMITGEEGTGQEVLGYEISYALLCEGETNKPCGVCKNCRIARKRNHPDLIVSQAKDKSSIGVDVIREEIEDTVAIKPLASNRKVYLIVDADKMTVQAQNSLLKTLEEPPAYAVFLLTTAHEKKLLPTVHSRCVRLETSILDDEELKNLLQMKYSLKEEELNPILSLSFGKIEQAFRLAENEDVLKSCKELPKLISDLETGMLHSLLVRMNEMAETGVEYAEVLGWMKLWYRDVLVYLTTQDTSRLVFKAFDDEIIKEGAAFRDSSSILQILEAIEDANNRLRASVGKETVLEVLREVVRTNRKKSL